VNAALLSRLENVLSVLDAATQASDLDLPGYRLHPLKGDMKGHWSISISGNWRITFRIENGDVMDVSLVDYH
jgi:proteic killer suppression protein